HGEQRRDQHHANEDDVEEGDGHEFRFSDPSRTFAGRIGASPCTKLGVARVVGKPCRVNGPKLVGYRAAIGPAGDARPGIAGRGKPVTRIVGRLSGARAGRAARSGGTTGWSSPYPASAFLRRSSILCAPSGLRSAAMSATRLARLPTH